MEIHGSIALFWPAHRLVDRGWVRLDGLRALTLDDVAHHNEFLDSVLDAEEKARARESSSR